MKKVFIIIIAAILFNCQDEKVKKGILAPQKMSEILIDIHIAEAKVNHISVGNRDTSAAIYVALQDEIFKKHKVSKKAYINSYRYYNSRPKEMDNIYAAVIDSLNVRQKLLRMD